MRPFADAVADYALAGWSCILPVPGAAKHPPPVGFTGADGRDTDPLTLATWAGTHASHSIALRMPDGVIGLDVDHYRKGAVDKRGGDSLAEYEQRWGALPATWRSSARELPSGIRFYRVPAGRYATKLGESIEIIQRHHRYAVVWPSPHHEVGAPYGWYDPDGGLSESVPKPDELPELPAAWIAGLHEGASKAGPAAADAGRGQVLLSALLADGRPISCVEMELAVAKATTELLAATSGSRHDVTTARAHHLIQLGAAGHPGAAEALYGLRMQWDALTAGEGREGEFERMLLTSARKAVTVKGARPVDRDPCFSGGERWSAPAPGGDASVPSPAPEVAPWSVREVIGAHLFDPRSDLDQGISGAVLYRMWPALRYVNDAGCGFSGPRPWENPRRHLQLGRAQLAELMPPVRHNPKKLRNAVRDAGAPTARDGSCWRARGNGVGEAFARSAAAPPVLAQARRARH